VVDHRTFEMVREVVGAPAPEAPCRPAKA
jgi:hypothetical protein